MMIIPLIPDERRNQFEYLIIQYYESMICRYDDNHDPSKVPEDDDDHHHHGDNVKDNGIDIHDPNISGNVDVRVLSIKKYQRIYQAFIREYPDYITQKQSSSKKLLSVDQQQQQQQQQQKQTTVKTTATAPTASYSELLDCYLRSNIEYYCPRCHHRESTTSPSITASSTTTTVLPERKNLPPRRAKKKDVESYKFPKVDQRFPCTFAQRYELLKHYYRHHGHCHITIPKEDDDDYDIRSFLCEWMMRLRKKYHRVMTGHNVGNNIPIKSNRSYDLTLDRIQLLNDIKFDFTIQYHQLYHQYHEKPTNNNNNNNNNNKPKDDGAHHHPMVNRNGDRSENKIVKSNDKHHDDSHDIPKVNSRRNVVSNKVAIKDPKPAKDDDDDFCRTIQSYNTKQEVKDLLVHIYTNVTQNIPNVFQTALLAPYHIRIQHYDMATDRMIGRVYYTGARHAQSFTGISRHLITAALRGNIQPNDPPDHDSWRYVRVIPKGEQQDDNEQFEEDNNNKDDHNGNDQMTLQEKNSHNQMINRSKADCAFYQELQTWNANQEVKDVFYRLYREHKVRDKPNLMKSAVLRCGIRIQRYNVMTNEMMGCYDSANHAEQCTNIPQRRITAILRGQRVSVMAGHENDGWRFIIVDTKNGNDDQQPPESEDGEQNHNDDDDVDDGHTTTNNNNDEVDNNDNHKGNCDNDTNDPPLENRKNAFYRELQNWNTSQEVKDIFYRMYQDQKRKDIPNLLKRAPVQYGIRVQHYHIGTNEMIRGPTYYTGATQAERFTQIPASYITSWLRGKHDDPDRYRHIPTIDPEHGWRYVRIDMTKERKDDDVDDDDQDENYDYDDECKMMNYSVPATTAIREDDNTNNFAHEKSETQDDDVSDEGDGGDGCGGDGGVGDGDDGGGGDGDDGDDDDGCSYDGCNDDGDVLWNDDTHKNDDTPKQEHNIEDSNHRSDSSPKLSKKIRIMDSSCDDYYDDDNPDDDNADSDYYYECKTMNDSVSATMAIREDNNNNYQNEKSETQEDDDDVSDDGGGDGDDGDSDDADSDGESTVLDDSIADTMVILEDNNYNFAQEKNETRKDDKVNKGVVVGTAGEIIETEVERNNVLVERLSYDGNISLAVGEDYDETMKLSSSNELRNNGNAECQKGIDKKDNYSVKSQVCDSLTSPSTFVTNSDRRLDPVDQGTQHTNEEINWINEKNDVKLPDINTNGHDNNQQIPYNDFQTLLRVSVSSHSKDTFESCRNKTSIVIQVPNAIEIRNERDYDDYLPTLDEREVSKSEVQEQHQISASRENAFEPNLGETVQPINGGSGQEETRARDEFELNFVETEQEQPITGEPTITSVTYGSGQDETRADTGIESKLYDPEQMLPITAGQDANVIAPIAIPSPIIINESDGGGFVERDDRLLSNERSDKRKRNMEGTLYVDFDGFNPEASHHDTISHNGDLSTQRKKMRLSNVSNPSTLCLSVCSNDDPLSSDNDRNKAESKKLQESYPLIEMPHGMLEGKYPVCSKEDMSSSSNPTAAVREERAMVEMSDEFSSIDDFNAKQNESAADEKVNDAMLPNPSSHCPDDKDEVLIYEVIDDEEQKMAATTVYSDRRHSSRERKAKRCSCCW